ncbi:MAG: ATP-dependent Clp protease proteolytic subunit [Akkermansiaceae bacterium]|nr:ATP-dependent Clp protease proteolytic subunit [Akkermansiaceae bacterium]
MKLRTPTSLIGLVLATGLTVAFAADKPAEAQPATPPPEDSASQKMAKEADQLALENKLQTERLTKNTANLREEITLLKIERELLTEKLALEAAKRQDAVKDEVAKLETEKEKLTRENELAKIRAEKLTNDLKASQTQAALKLAQMQNEIALIETTAKHAQFARSKPIYLKNPLKADGTLVISDRRIPLNGPISSSTADFITTRIDYWNNKDRQLPIFILIDDCPGGSVMAGYRILKAMEASDAPVHVVVKSFAASMAACITTLAKESYAYPNAIILHHQISSQIVGARMNLTQQREFFEESSRWWTRLATPIATKMGITTEEMIKKMYACSTSGDWSEFGDQAKELKWVDHIISGIEETSFTKDPDAGSTVSAPAPVPPPPHRGEVTEELDEEGRPFTWLPRLNPKDVYFIYNPDGYYRVR